MPELKAVVPPKDQKNGVFCHRMYISIPFAEEIPATAVTPRQMRPAGDIRFLQCLKEQCALFNKEKGACADLVGTQAAIENTRIASENFKILKTKIENQNEKTIISMGSDNEQ